MITDSIDQARQLGASDDDILKELYSQNPQLQHSIDSAKQLNANATSILSEITKQNIGGTGSQPDNTNLPEKQPWGSYDIMKPAAPEAGIVEKAVRGTGNFISNALGKVGETVGNVSRSALNYAGGAITALPAAINNAQEAVNPLTGDTVKPWFSNSDGTPQDFTQWSGEVLQHGAELAPWLMGGGEAEAGLSAAAPVAEKAASLGGKVLQIAKDSAPMAAGLGTSGALDETGKQMQSGDYNVPKIIATGATDAALAFGTEMGLRGVASKIKVANPNLPDQEARTMAQQAIDETKKIFNPTKAETNKIIFKQRKDIDNGFSSILENVSPESISKDASGRRLDTISAVEDMKKALAESSQEAQGVLIKNPMQSNIEMIRDNALKDLKENKYNLPAVEIEDRAANINKIVDAEIKLNNGSPIFESAKLDKIKSGLWNIGKFDKGYSNIPSMVESARSVGFAIKDHLESMYKGIADIQALNKKTSDIFMGLQLLENANGRLIPKGINPMARLAIMMGAHRVPFVGPILAEKATNAVDSALHNPERLFTKASEKFNKAPKLK
jgi:hypothetical protein